MARIIHVVPFDGIGGVECAARSMGSARVGDSEFEVDYIFTNIRNSGGFATFNPVAVLSAAWRASRPDVELVIVSLWRGALVGFVAKLLRPKLKLVTFLHSSNNAHLIDAIFTYLSIWLATEIWADSKATLSSRFSGFRSKNRRVISFVTRRFDALPTGRPEPAFIFWGRLSPPKGLDRSIRLFAEVRQKRADARLWIVGPDGGVLGDLKWLCAELGVQDDVFFLGAETHDEIARRARHASFYLQTSLYEGMAMSVVESMQLGLVPVVTPVGEIPRYCLDGVNAVVIASNRQAVDEVITLIDADDRYHSMREKAIAKWFNQPLYRDSVLAACRDLLQS